MSQEFRQTTSGSDVQILKTLGKDVYLIKAITRRGCYICQVAESDLKPVLNGCDKDSGTTKTRTTRGRGKK